MTLEWTGERYVPEIRGTIALEHLHRYAFACEHVKGLDVLDIASGEGYGSEMLSRTAKHVYGVDIDEESVRHAQAKYLAKNLKYIIGSCTEIPLEDASVDVVVSFETIEHITDHAKMMSEVKRVLRPGGTLLISSPEKSVYDDINQKPNPFHLKELSQKEFRELLGSHFKNTSFLGQRALHGSALVGVDGQVAVARTYNFSSLPGKIESMEGLAMPVYIVAICSDKPLKDTSGSLCEQNIWESEYCINVAQTVTDQEVLIGKRDLQISERDQWLQNAKSAIDERDERLIQAAHEIEQKISQNDHLSEVVTERQKFIANLESALAQREETLCHLDQSLAERDKQIGGLNNTIAIRDGLMSELLGNMEILSSRISERDTQIGVLTEAISAKDGRLSELAGNLESLNASLGERDKQIGDLNEALSTRDAQIGELGGSLERLNKSVGERDNQIRVLTEAISVKDGLFNKLAEKLQILNVSMVERDKQIAGLHDVIASRDEQIGLLNQDIGEKEKQISDLNQTMIGKEKIINEVTQLLTHSHESLSKLTSSLRWRITRPVELLSNACDGMKKRLQKYVAAIRIYRTHRASGVFDPVWYLEKNADVRSSWMHPWWHFLFFGITENRAPNVNFYPEAYMSINHDVAGSHLGAVEHYMTFGWKEGRNLGGNPNITDWVNHYRLQLADLDKSKKTVLIVTHEITRTGAPILVLNLADKLRRDFNTIILSLGGGPLLADFEKASDIFIGPLMGLQSSQDFLSEFIKGINVIHSIDCALVNSIVNVLILKPLWENNVPSANLIHEFASNRRPHSLFLESMFFSTKQVYSSNLILENALKYHQYIKNKNPLVLPQGRCKPPVEKNNDQLIEREKSRIETLFKTEGDLNKTFIVIGLGTVQLRKGVDLFLECAQRVKRIQSKVPIRFVWFGHGYDPELDGEYSVYLQQRIECSGLESMCFITHESDQLDHIYTNANLLFLSSRLDPLPLVAQDMLSYGKPVVCFDQATGLAEYFKKDKTLRKLVCDYLDVEDAARKIVELANDQKKYLDVCIAADNLSKKTFDFDIYVKEISELCDSIIKDNQNVTSEELIINEAGVLQPDFFGFGWGMPQGDNQTRNYLSLWSMGFCNKKPFPGFHPGIYAETNCLKSGDPLADFLRQGKPDGPWIKKIIRPGEEVIERHKHPKTALHLHIYYADLANELLSRYAINKSRPDLLISVPDEKTKKEVDRVLNHYSIKTKRMVIVPNKGRDLGPLLTEFREEIIDNYEIIGHIHTKKTPHHDDRLVINKWVTFLFENLLGGDQGERMMDVIISHLAESPEIGIIFPDDPNVAGWDKNLEYAEEIARKTGIKSLPKNIIFPMGSMFWAKTNILKKLYDLKLDWNDYPVEPLPIDGSMLHAIERLFSIFAENEGYKVAVTHVPGITR